MCDQDSPSHFLLLNGLFLLIAAIGISGLARTGFPGSVWLSITWGLWIAANYLFLIRIKVCRYCSYYGQRCPLGWGVWTSRIISQGEEARFSQRGWPIVYFFSFAILPPGAMTISLFFQFDFPLFTLLAAFIFLGLILFLSARITCCVNCLMEPKCLLSKINPHHPD